MENLNAEQIKKALECWESGSPCHEKCSILEHEEGGNCLRLATRSALALIISQEQRIKELGEENEILMQEKTALECVVSTARNQAKADTVQKMQERLMQKILENTVGNDSFAYFLKSYIDQVAKEMLEE